MRSSIDFGSLLVYSPRGAGDTSRRSRNVCYRIKDGSDDVVARAAELVVKNANEGGVLASFFAENTTLVPTPRSAPLLEGQLWPAERICNSLQQHGAAPYVERLLRREVAVPKSAIAAPGERPGPDTHFETMAIDPQLAVPASITVVDDVVTRGSTLIAAVSLLAEHFPDIEVRGFAVVRTMGLVPDVERIHAPAVGTIRLIDGILEREP